jgi:hypothetical protein
LHRLFLQQQVLYSEPVLARTPKRIQTEIQLKLLLVKTEQTVEMVCQAATAKMVPQELTGNQVHPEKLAYQASREHQENLVNQENKAPQENLVNQVNKALRALQVQHLHRLNRLRRDLVMGKGFLGWALVMTQSRHHFDPDLLAAFFTSKPSIFLTSPQLVRERT